MFRNSYDTDVTVWSPEGRLLQVRDSLILKDRPFASSIGELLNNPPHPPFCPLCRSG